MRRLTFFIKGNVDVHDSLHSCRIGGGLAWNGINDVFRASKASERVQVCRAKYKAYNESCLCEQRLCA
jgi:hypothetical protein